MTIAQRISQNSTHIGGGAVGVGAPLALREFVDQNGPLVEGEGELVSTLTRPSVAWGVGGGALTGALWLLGIGSEKVQDFWLTHALTAIPSGVISAAVPPESQQAQTQRPDPSRARQRPLRESRSTNGQDQREFEPADGVSAELSEAQ